MRIALVSPYSWSYPGGVTRHIEALAEQHLAAGHDVRVLAPLDPPDRAASLMHRGAWPQRIAAPDYLIPLGRTVGVGANGAISNLSFGACGVARLSRELARGGYDVIHIHEPVAPMVGWVATLPFGTPLVGTFHSYSAKWLPNAFANAFGATQVLNRLHVRIAVSQAAAWTGRRWFGGTYRVIPNGVSVDQDALVGALALGRERAHQDPQQPLRIVFVGQAVERKGLPVLVRAFEALRDHIPAQLTVIGPSEDELAPLLLDGRGVRALGKVDDQTKRRELCAADVFVAPSLGGESFGMVLTEAFAAGAAVVASDIAGYRDVVSAGSDGLLVPAGDAQALAEAVRELYHEPQRRLQLAERAAQTVQRFAWEQVAGEVMRAYEDAIAVPEPVGVRRKLAVWSGFAPADMGPRVYAQRLESIEPPLASEGRQRGRWARLRRWLTLGAGLMTAALAYLGLRRIGIASVGATLVSSEPTYVLLGLTAMAVAMLLRGLAWHAAVRAALPRARIGLRDTLRATMIGVLMSATLPARLGEPSRALVLARRTGRPRDTLPVLLGTVVSQTAINVVALILLGALTFSVAGFLAGHDNVLIITAGAPSVLLLGLVLAPLLLRRRNASTRFVRLSRAIAALQLATGRARGGLAVFGSLRLGATAISAQLAAWAVQILACYLLLVALGLGQRVGLLAAAAVLFAVNVTAVLPATPANVGVFQFACATVLATGWHIGWGTGVAYGVILQAVEIATAILMGAPALLREGMSWREVRLRALHAAPIKLPPRGPAADGAYAAVRVGSSSWRG